MGARERKGGKERKEKEGKGWERSVGAREWLEMGGGEEAAGLRGRAADGKWVRRIARTAADGCGRRGCQGVAGNGWGEEAAENERAWLCGRLRTANGRGELRGRLRTAWVHGSGWKWVGRRRRWG